MPTPRLLSAVIFFLPWIASCVQTEAPIDASIDGAGFGVQIFNYLPRAARIDVVVARSEDGPWRRVHDGREVARLREPIDPSLGDDPGAMRDLPLALDDGAWVVKAVETVSGESATAQLRADGHTWMIAFVGAAGITVVTDIGPRHLE